MEKSFTAKCKALASCSLLLLCMATLGSCGDKQGKQDTGVKVHLQMRDEQAPLNLSDVAEKVELVRLETDSSALIGQVDKMIIHDGRLYILDKQRASTVFVYTEDGHFLHTIGEKGHAGNEYIELTDVCVGGDKVYILDNRSEKINVYAMDGKYEESLKMPYQVYAFRHLEGDVFGFSCEYTPNKKLEEAGKYPNYISCNVRTGKTKTDLMFEDMMSPDAIPMTLNNLNDCFYQGLDWHIYRATEEGCEAVAEFLMPESCTKNRDGFLQTLAKKSVDVNSFEEWQSQSPFPSLITSLSTGNILYTYWRKGSYLYAAFTDLQTGTSKEGSATGSLPIHNDMDDSLPFIIPQYASDGCLYCILAPEMMRADVAQGGANEESHYYLLKIKLRSDF